MTVTPNGTGLCMDAMNSPVSANFRIVSKLTFGLLLAISLLVFTPRWASSEPERRIALLIGNGAYATAPLANPANDAEDMAKVLKGCGFKVTIKINANRAEMREAIGAFGDQIMRGGVGLFFYAGHGLQVDGENYLVPIGADVKRKVDIQDQCLAASYVLQTMEEAKNGMNIIILDACRNNPFRGFRSTGQGLAHMDAPSGSILAYSTAPGSVASDGQGRNGLYTSKMLKHITTPGQRLEDMFIKVRNEVKAESEDRQIPWETQSLTGVFYFVPGDNAVTEPADKPPASAPAPKSASIASEDRIDASGSSAALGFQVNYVYRSKGKGDLKPIQDGTVLRSGDHYKIMFTPDKDSYVYIFQADSSGQLFQLFPMEEFDGVHLNNVNPVKKGASYTLPALNKAFVLDNVTGKERFYFFASQGRSNELEGLYKQLVEARNRKNQSQVAEAQAKLEQHFKRRGMAGIAQDRDMVLTWDDESAPGEILGKKLENICDGCLHLMEFKHD